MSKFQNVVVELSCEKELFDRFKSLGGNPIIEQAENVHLISVFNEKQKNYLPLNIETAEDIEEYFKNLHSEIESILSKGSGAKFTSHLHLNANSTIDAVDFLKEIKADLVVTATRGDSGVKGVFQNSFTEFMVENSPCDIYVIRPD